MKISNKYIYDADPEVLATLRSEYIMLGFDTELSDGCLTVLARKKKKTKKKRERFDGTKRDNDEDDK